MIPSWKDISHRVFNGRKAESFRFTGSGGHGLVTASVILAKAGIYDGNNVLQSQVYGAEARGSTTKSETVIRHGEIYYPKLVAPDVLFALTSEGLMKYRTDVIKEGIIIYDSILIPDEKPSDAGPYTFGFPMWAEILKELKSGTAINILALGVIVALTDVVENISIEKAVHENFKPEYHANNQKALELGYSFAKEVKNG